MSELSVAAPAASNLAGTSRRAGLGRMRIAFYGVLAFAATGRSSVQLATKAGEAPIPCALSALAAVVDVATVGLGRAVRLCRRVAWIACGTELVGVLVIGTLGPIESGWFPDDTVWSGFGSGHGYLPLVLPLAGLAWLRHTDGGVGPAGDSEQSKRGRH